MKLLFVLLMLPSLVLGGNPNVYLSAEFDHQDFYPRSGLIFDINPLEPGMTGDLLSGAGNMETGAVGGGCTYCPTGFTCICSDASDVTQETSKVYKNSASAKSVMGATGNSSVLWTLDLEANAVYQITLRYKAETGGTEDFRIQLYQGAQSYDFSTDTWGGAAVASYNNIGSSWATTNLYVNNGPIARAGAVLWISSISINQTIYWDDLQIHKLKSTGPTSAIGPYTMNPAVTSDPVFGSNPSGQMRFADGPAQNKGTVFNGTTDYLTCSHADCGAMADPTGDFSVACLVTPSSVANHTVIKQVIGVYDGPTNQRGWVLTKGAVPGTGMSVIISNDGTSGAHRTLVDLPTGYSNANSDFATAFRYQNLGNLASNLTLYSWMTSATSAIAVSPIHHSTAPFIMGNIAVGVATEMFDGAIKHCSIYNRYLSEPELYKWFWPHFPGNNYNSGSYVTTCSQVASHATCSYDNCRDGTPSGCQSEGTGSMAIFGQGTELIPYNSFETVTGDDSAPTFTGWSLSGSNGTAYRDEKKHGNVSVRLTSSVVGSVRQITGGCTPVTPTTSYYGEFSGKKLSSESNVYLIMYEYSDGACSAYVTSQLIRSGTNIGHSFSAYGASKTTGAGTNSVTIAVQTYSGSIANQDILIDTVSLKAGTYHTPWVHNPGAGTTTYNARDYRIHNTLADPIHSTGAYPFSTGFCAGGWLYSDWVGNDGVSHGIYEILPTAGAANRVALFKNGSDELSFNVYDSAGGRVNYWIAVDATKFPAGWKYVEGCSSNTGTVKARLYNPANTTWYNAVLSLGGTGIQDGQSTTLHIGYSPLVGAYMNGFIHKFYIAPYNPAYSMHGFNSGRPPMNGQRPY